jgi:hypothetical protein
LGANRGRMSDLGPVNRTLPLLHPPYCRLVGRRTSSLPSVSGHRGGTACSRAGWPSARRRVPRVRAGITAGCRSQSFQRSGQTVRPGKTQRGQPSSNSPFLKDTRSPRPGGEAGRDLESDQVHLGKPRNAHQLGCSLGYHCTAKAGQSRQRVLPDITVDVLA